MKKTILTIGLLASGMQLKAMQNTEAQPLLAPEAHVPIGHPVIPTAPSFQAEQTEAPSTLGELGQLYKVNQEIRAEKVRHAKAKVQIYNKWDRKTANIALLFAAGIAVKTGFDIYTTISEPTLPLWITITNLALDGVFLGGTTGFGLFHHIKACCRKAKVE